MARVTLPGKKSWVLMGTVMLAGWAGIDGRAQPAAAPELAVLRSRAEQSDRDAQNSLGNAYTNAQLGLPRDYAEALKWYRRAGDSGFAPAQFNLGLVYELGRGVKADEALAFKYYLMAAGQGFAAAQFNVGNMYSTGRGVGQDFFEANLWYKQAAENGVIEAHLALGLAYEIGRGVKKDETQAARWYKQAADRGLARAQYNLGLLFEDGRGVAKNETEAARLYRAAAEQGFGPAQNNFGLMLHEGRGGLARDPGQAYAWLSLAVENGSPPAARDSVAKTLTPGQLAAATRLLEERRAGRAGPVVAPFPPGPVDAAAAARVNELTQALEKARQANAQLADANQRLELEKTRREQEPASGGASGKLVEQLREQSRRLAAQVQALTADKETAEREAQVLAAQFKDAQQKTGSAAVTAAETGELPAPGLGQDNAVAGLQRDNARLNAEVKRATVELLSLNQQIRALRATPDKAAATGAGNDAALADLRAENQRIVGDNMRLQSQRDAAVHDVELLQTQLQQQVQALQHEKADGEKWAQSLEKTLNEKSAAANASDSGLTELRQKLAQAQKQLDDNSAALATQEQLARKLAGDNRTLTERASQAEAALSARPASAATPAQLQDLKRELAEASQALEKSGATVAELTGANDRLDKELAAARKDAVGAGGLQAELAKARREAADTAALREENKRLHAAAGEAAALHTKSDQLAKDNEQLTAFMNSNRHDLDKAQARVGELEKQLEEARTIRTRGGDDAGKLQVQLTEAAQAVEKLNATVAELTGANDKLEKDLDSARKSTEAALAAQTQAVSAAQPDAYKMEISTLQARVKELEGQLEEDRNNTAKEIGTLAAQLQRTRESNKSLTEANRALMSAKQSEQPVVSKDEFDQLQGQVRELTAIRDELKRQNQKLADDSQRVATERETFKSQLEDARKVATLLPGLADEKAALQERLEAVGAQLVKAQQELDALQKANGETTAQGAASKQAAEKAQADLAALQARMAEAEKATESHKASVAELTDANTKLETERDELRKQLAALRADNVRLGQAASSTEQLKADSDRSAQQNIEALTAQLAQTRRDLQGARDTNSRLAEAGAKQERDRAAALAQLRQENNALLARLTQAQNTLDQIASAARLGTPASTIAAGGVVPVRPAASAAEPRIHTVAEGDSLSRISLRYYGTPNRWQEIYQANRELLSGSNALRVGMQLRIP